MPWVIRLWGLQYLPGITFNTPMVLNQYTEVSGNLQLILFRYRPPENVHVPRRTIVKFGPKPQAFKVPYRQFAVRFQ